MKNRKPNVALYTFVIILTISAVIFTGYNIYGRSSQKYSYSLLPKYSNVQSIYDESDIIVMGEIKKVKETLVVDRRDYYILATGVNKEEFMPSYSKYVVSEVKIDKVLKGDIEQGKTIEVMQETIYDKSSDNELIKVKVFKDNEKYVLFLKYYNPESEQAQKDFVTPKYIPVGMYQGQLEIVNDKVEIDKGKSQFFDSEMMTVEEIEKVILERGTK